MLRDNAMPDMLCFALQEVQNLLALPAQVHAMIQGGIPWWQIMYTGLMSTDAVLMIEVSLSCGLPYTISWTYGCDGNPPPARGC